MSAASNWNPDVAAHVYNITGIRIALENGVKSLEHAYFIDEASSNWPSGGAHG